MLNGDLSQLTFSGLPYSGLEAVTVAVTGDGGTIDGFSGFCGGRCWPLLEWPLLVSEAPSSSGSILIFFEVDDTQSSPPSWRDETPPPVALSAAAVAAVGKKAGAVGSWTGEPPQEPPESLSGSILTVKLSSLVEEGLAAGA